METAHGAGLPPLRLPKLLLAEGTSSLYGGGNVGSVKSPPGARRCCC